MEKNSILRLLRFTATRSQSITTSTRQFSALARRRDGIFRDSPRPIPSLVSSTRHPAIFCSKPRLFYAASSDAPSKALASPKQKASADGSESLATKAEMPQRPTYQITFTCKPCLHRSTHLLSKLSYHRGAVLIQCPGCKSRHVISDHLGIFSNEKKSLEDIMKDQGELVKKGTLNEGGDIEFWDDEAEQKEASVTRKVDSAAAWWFPRSPKE